MYYPLQIPYILKDEHLKHISYCEEIADALEDFVICIWQLTPRSSANVFVNNIIATDGCIDLVVNFTKKQIGFVGMSKTNFNFKISTQEHFFGARMKPGTFHQITNLSATLAMDSFVSLKAVDINFDTKTFFALSFEGAKEVFIKYLKEIFDDEKPNEYVMLFDKLSNELPRFASEVYKMLNLSPRQCQRNFLKHFGINPQLALSIIRFQHCLKILTSGTKTNDVLESIAYYDQSHFIKEFKRNIGLTPQEYLARCKR
ncbi:MAG: helix-turn-helix domain-containing protein [Defluviitaleaceae bacterium]|nr:helix-turn-helix domain-containing protein [Defluviitaleaceae bacterium]